MRLFLAALLLAGFLAHALYLAFSPPLGLAGDEAHYWDWSRQLDWSYYSKGPAVAVLIRAGTSLFGDTLLGVRLMALVLAVGTSVCAYWLTARVFKSEKLALGVVLLMHTMPMCLGGSMLMTIDPPFFFCWALATCLGYLAAVEEKKWAFLLAGVVVGLGFLAKYAALLWLVNALIFLAIANRKLLKTPWPWLMCLIALAFTAPVLWWNHQHDWVSFGHVARSTSENQNHFNPLKILGHFGEMVGSQLGLLNPIVAGFLIGGVWLTFRRNRNAATTYLLCIGVPFFGFVSLITLFKNTEPNWPAPTYFSLLPITGWFIAVTWPKGKGWLIGAIVFGLAVMVVLHEPTWFIRIKPIAQGTARIVGYDDVGKEVSAELRKLGPGAFVLCDKYQLAGWMAFYVDGHPKTFCMGSYIKDSKKRDRLTQYDIWPDRDLSQFELLGRDAIFVGKPQPDLYEAFEKVEELPVVTVKRRGVTLRKQGLWRCSGFRGMARPADGLTKR
ncbi:MAG: glycosyltransferase family 39 protein [Tepidisphaeraceae bacterium]